MIQAALPILGTVAQGVLGIFRGREERRTVRAQAEGALAQAKQEGRDRVELSRAEWEAIMAQGTHGSWKDEYVTLVITSPIVGVLAGAVWEALFGDPRLLDGVLRGMNVLADLGFDMGELMFVVVLAAVGIKAWRLR